MLCSMAAAALADVPPTRFEVKSLPGWTGPLPSKMYTGFVDAGPPPSGKGEMYFHYLMYEAESDPANAPTVFWYNGGPGASSLFGMFQELGPLFLNVDSESSATYNKTGIPEPQYNPHTWSKKFNLFAIDSPAPVGFSYCTEFGPSGGGTSCGPWKDTDVFKANHKVVTTIMNEIFPELKKNELYITGESYAGVYVPGLINELIDDMQGLNLKGYAVGDGCMGTEVCCFNLDAPLFTYPGTWGGPYYDIEFFAGHGQVSNELYNAIRAQCPEANLRSGKGLSPQCEAMIQHMGKEIGGFFVYDLFDDCPSNMISHGLHKNHASRQALMNRLNGAENDYACSGTAMTDWFGRSDVRAALGIPVNDFFFNADNGHGFNYTSNVKDIRPIHEKAYKAGLRVLIYEGDSDASGLSSFGLQDVYVEMWAKLGLNRTQTWRPWTSDGKKRMAGYAMEWEGGKIAHLTIRGSGHMVPLNKPIPSFTMINAFVANSEYPKYN